VLSTILKVIRWQETLSSSLFELSSAKSSVRKWLQEKGSASVASSSSLGVEEVGCVGEGRIGDGGVESVLKLPATVLACINALQNYLSQFNLQQVSLIALACRCAYEELNHIHCWQVLKLTGNLWRFASGTHMVVEASVLENLEVIPLLCPCWQLYQVCTVIDFNKFS
jgi:hypothetical protein